MGNLRTLPKGITITPPEGVKRPEPGIPGAHFLSHEDAFREKVGSKLNTVPKPKSFANEAAPAVVAEEVKEEVEIKEEKKLPRIKMGMSPISKPKDQE